VCNRSWLGCQVKKGNKIDGLVVKILPDKKFVIECAFEERVVFECPCRYCKAVGMGGLIGDGLLCNKKRKHLESGIFCWYFLFPKSEDKRHKPFIKLQVCIYGLQKQCIAHF